MKHYLTPFLWACIVVPSAVRAQNTSTPGPQAAPVSGLIEGEPVEKRPPEKSDDKPAFPEQTRAPYHATAPYKITTLIDNLPAPWSLAFLPDGKILLTERLPGSIRILDKNGALSEPVAGVREMASPTAKDTKDNDIGVLDVVLDPKFTTV
jgi:glucose/arabinose dehydrogenase